MLKNISKRSLFLILCDAAAIAGAYYAAWFVWTGGEQGFLGRVGNF